MQTTSEAELKEDNVEEEECSEPYKTLYDIAEKIANIDDVLAADFVQNIINISWDPAVFHEFSNSIPEDFRASYKALEKYIRNINTEPISTILGCGGPPFSCSGALIVADRISNEYTLLEAREQYGMKVQFMRKVLHMIAEEELEEDENNVCARIALDLFDKMLD